MKNSQPATQHHRLQSKSNAATQASEASALSGFARQLGKVHQPERSRMAHEQSWSLIAERIGLEATNQHRPNRLVSLFGWRSALVPAALTVMVILVITMTQHSIPGDSLYSIKRGIENAQLALSLSDAKKADACSMQMKRRANELARIPDSQLHISTVRQLNRSILEEAAEFQEYIQNSGGDKTRLQDQRQRDIAYVLQALQSASLHAQDAQQRQIIANTMRSLRASV